MDVTGGLSEAVAKLPGELQPLFADVLAQVTALETKAASDALALESKMSSDAQALLAPVLTRIDALQETLTDLLRGGMLVSFPGANIGANVKKG